MTQTTSTRRSLTCATPQAMRALGSEVARILEPGDVLILIGELGAGKTTFVKGVVGELGAGVAVTSPTFVLCHLYDTNPPIAHVDCWRLDGPSDVVDIALEEILDDGGVALIEWGEVAAPSLGRDVFRVEINLSDGDATDEIDPLSGAPVATRVVEFFAEAGTWSERIAHLGAMR